MVKFQKGALWNKITQQNNIGDKNYTWIYLWTWGRGGGLEVSFLALLLWQSEFETGWLLKYSVRKYKIKWIWLILKKYIILKPFMGFLIFWGTPTPALKTRISFPDCVASECKWFQVKVLFTCRGKPKSSLQESKLKCCKSSNGTSISSSDSSG